GRRGGEAGDPGRAGAAGGGKAEPEPAEAEAEAEARLGTGAGAEELEPAGPLLADADTYVERWKSVQTGFVDEPEYAVESAGPLLGEVLDELAKTLAAKRSELEATWRHDGDT